MRLADSHCHIDFPELCGRMDELLDQARQADVAYMLCVAVNLEDFPNILALSDAYQQISASVGVHPNTLDGADPTVERLIDLAKDDRVVAVGETGLDYFRSAGELGWQRDRFERHIEAAKAVGKPVIVHSRNAPEDTIGLLRRCGAQDAGGVMHCFTGDYEMARQAMDLGFYISFSGIVTFRNAADLAEVARKIPMEHMLIETDSPYLAPVPKRGRQNQPAYVRHTAEFLASLKGLELEQLAEITTENYLDLFSVQKHS